MTEMGKHITTKIKEELKKMNNSTDLGYTKTYIPWRDNDGFSVECTRMDDDSVLIDEDGDVVNDSSGEAVGFSVYYQRDGKDFDCCSLDCFLDDREMQQIDEFVKMYV